MVLHYVLVNKLMIVLDTLEILMLVPYRDQLVVNVMVLGLSNVQEEEELEC